MIGRVETDASIGVTTSSPVKPGSDLRDNFRRAYENRYTWEPGFGGYQGRCIWKQGDQQVEGRFEIGADLKAISSQLWEIAIHRVRRSFEQTHGANTFTAGETDSVGTEVIIGGKGEGDRYRIKDDVVTMVHRHIHGTVVTIFTTAVTDTGSGYLSKTYTSQYADPESGEIRGGRSNFTDTFVPLEGNGRWVLEERVIETEAHGETPAGSQTFRFEDLQAL